MKTDRELLELAAKAAGIEVRWTGKDVYRGSFLRRVDPKPEPPLSEWLYWRPLHDDGDALRLAVKLRLKIQITDYGAAVRIDCEILSLVALDEAPGVESATRRAIVRAAAAIGEQMQNELSREA
jgi:hypothetical protein